MVPRGVAFAGQSGTTAFDDAPHGLGSDQKRQSRPEREPG